MELTATYIASQIVIIFVYLFLSLTYCVKSRKLILAFIYGICATAIICTFKGPLTLLYATGSMLYTFSIWQKNNKVYRFLGIPVTLIVIVDSIIIKSVFGVILQGVVLIASIAGSVSHKENKEDVIEVENSAELKVA